MKVDESRYSIANIRDMMQRGDLTANREYQRSPGLWPNGPRSYFIDTILSGFPFPKIYFHEFLEKATKRTRAQIVDGQQRVTTIIDFINNNFALGKNSKNNEGKRFSDLDEDIQDSFLSYTISVDVIRDADRPQILEMFRRMNAYTLPLNAAEKRHAEFFGEFKDFVTRVLDRNTKIFTEWAIFSPRQIMRMSDAELIADLALAFEEGVVSTSDSKLHSIYKKYDPIFPNTDQYERAITEILDVIATSFSGLRGSFMTKSYAFFALCCALHHNQHGLPNFQDKTGIAPIGQFLGCPPDIALSNLLELAAAHEGKDLARYPEYVEAMSGGTNREKQRVQRISAICMALRNTL